MKTNKIIGAALSIITAVSVMIAGCLNAFAYEINAVAANEGKLTVWIFAVLIGLAAVAGIVYFIIQHKNKK